MQNISTCSHLFALKDQEFRSSNVMMPDPNSLKSVPDTMPKCSLLLSTHLTLLFSQLAQCFHSPPHRVDSSNCSHHTAVRHQCVSLVRWRMAKAKTHDKPAKQQTVLQRHSAMWVGHHSRNRPTFIQVARSLHRKHLDNL